MTTTRKITTAKTTKMSVSIQNAWETLYREAIRDIEAHKKREEELETTIALMETERGEANSNVMKNAEALIYDLQKKDTLIRKLQEEVTALKYRLKLYSPSYKVTPRSSLEDRVWDDVHGCWTTMETV